MLQQTVKWKLYIKADIAKFTTEWEWTQKQETITLIPIIPKGPGEDRQFCLLGDPSDG